MRAGASPCTPAVPPTLCRAHLRGVCAVRRARQAASGGTHLMGAHAKLGWAPAAQASHTKADSTLRSSRAVPHPSTNRALRRLTSEVRRDPVHSTRYGRQRKDCQCSALDGPRVCGAGSFFAGGHAASIAPELFWPSEVKRRMARLERG